MYLYSLQHVLKYQVPIWTLNATEELDDCFSLGLVQFLLVLVHLAKHHFAILVLELGEHAHALLDYGLGRVLRTIKVHDAVPPDRGERLICLFEAAGEVALLVCQLIPLEHLWFLEEAIEGRGALGLEGAMA